MLKPEAFQLATGTGKIGRAGAPLICGSVCRTMPQHPRHPPAERSSKSLGRAILLNNMEIIARAILARADEQKSTVGKAVEKAKGLLARVSWFRLASVSATTVAALAVGLPPVGLLGEGLGSAVCKPAQGR